MKQLLLTALTVMALNFCSGQVDLVERRTGRDLPATDTLKVFILLSDTSKIQSRYNPDYKVSDSETVYALLVRKKVIHVDEPGTSCWNCPDYMRDDHFLWMNKRRISDKYIIWNYKLVKQ